LYLFLFVATEIFKKQRNIRFFNECKLNIETKTQF